ncbi:hypothetical protein Tco_1495501, partial [Tanacetum coccineum]
GIFSIEAKDKDMKLLSAPESNNTLAKCWFRRNIPSTSFTQWEVSGIPIFFSWSGSISFDSFLPSVLLWLVIIVAVVGVGGTVLVVVLESSYVAYAFHQDRASSVRVPVENVTLFSSTHLLRENTHSVRVPIGPVFLLGLLVPAIVAAYASRAAVTLSTTSFLMVA